MHVVFGGSGGLGAAVVRELAARGLPVRAVSRSGSSSGEAGVESVAADAANPVDARRACEGANVVYCCAGVPYTDNWAKNWPPLLAGIIEGAAAAGARLVMADNVYMYPSAETARLHEDLPEQPDTRKGEVRAQMSGMLRGAHESGRVQVVTARASDFYGPGVTNAAMGERVFEPALQGRKTTLLGDIDAPHSYAYIDDVARAVILLGERDEALGQIWHVPHAPAVSTRVFVEKAFQAAGHDPKIQVAPKVMVTVLGWFNPMMRELKEMLYQWEQPFIVDDSKFRKAFPDAAEPTSIEDGVAATVEWYRRRAA